MKKLTSMAVLAAAGMAASAASGTTLIGTSFEGSEGYVTGNLNGQNGWASIFGASNGATGSTVGFNVVTNASNARTGTNYVEINTSQFPNDSGATNYKYGLSFQSVSLTTADVTNRSVHIKVGVWQSTAVNANKTSYSLVEVYAGATNLLTMGVYNSASSALTSRAFLSATGNTTGYILNNGTTTAGGTNNWLNQWWMCDIVLNYQTNHMTAHMINATTDYDLGGSLESGVGYSMAIPSGAIFTDADMFIERDAHAGSTNSGGGITRFDDYSVSLEDKVPAPSSVALLGLGGMMVGRRRRR